MKTQQLSGNVGRHVSTNVQEKVEKKTKKRRVCLELVCFQDHETTPQTQAQKAPCVVARGRLLLSQGTVTTSPNTFHGAHSTDLSQINTHIF